MSGREALQAGLAAFQAGRLDLAISRLKEARRILPHEPQVALYLGMFLYEQTKASPEAQGLMEIALEAFPDNQDLNLRLLDSYLRGKSQTKVDALLGRLRGRMQENSRFAFNVLYTLVRHGYVSAARDELGSTGRSLQGEMAFISGLIEMSAANRPEALKHFRNAVRLGFPPRASRQMLTLAESFYQLGEHPAAVGAFIAYLEHHPEDPAPHRFKLALSYFACGDFTRALEQMTLVSRLAPGMEQVRYYIGTILIEMKKTEEARPHFDAELKTDPGSFRAMTKIAHLEYLKGDDASCRRLLEASLAMDARWFETHMVFGLLHMRLSEYDRAVASFEACLREEPEYPKAHFQLSQAYQRLGNAPMAKRYLESFNRLQEAATARTLEALGMSDKK